LFGERREREGRGWEEKGGNERGREWREMRYGKLAL